MSEETIPQMRERIDTLEKDNSSKDKALAEAQKEVRKLTARDVFRDAGYNPKHAELFVAGQEGDITLDAVTKFADDYGLAKAEVQVVTPPSGESSDQGNLSPTAPGSNLSGMSRAGTGAGEGTTVKPPTNTMPRLEWEELNRTDPVAAGQVAREGRVQIRKDNPYAQR